MPKVKVWKSKKEKKIEPKFKWVHSVKVVKLFGIIPILVEKTETAVQI